DIERQPAPAVHAYAGSRRGVLDPQAPVAESLLEEALAQVARRDPAPGAPRPRARVDAEDHGDRRLVDPDGRKRRGTFAIGDGLADVDVLDAGHRDDVARERALDLDPLEPFPGVDVRQLAGRLRAVVPAQHVLAAGGELAGHDPPDAQPADVIVVAQVVRLEARRRIRLVGPAGQEAGDGLQERPEIWALP